jgi:hypothetical protein
MVFLLVRSTITPAMALKITAGRLNASMTMLTAVLE